MSVWSPCSSHGDRSNIGACSGALSFSSLGHAGFEAPPSSFSLLMKNFSFTAIGGSQGSQRPRWLPGLEPSSGPVASRVIGHSISLTLGTLLPERSCSRKESTTLPMTSPCLTPPIPSHPPRVYASVHKSSGSSPWGTEVAGGNPA